MSSSLSSDAANPPLVPLKLNRILRQCAKYQAEVFKIIDSLTYMYKTHHWKTKSAVCLVFFSYLFHSYGDVTFAGEDLIIRPMLKAHVR